MTKRNIIRVFPRRTSYTPKDDLVFVGEPPLFDLPDVPVYISVTFSWDIKESERLLESWKKRSKRVEIGGPLFSHINIPNKWKRFYPGRFVKEGITFTSRGCNKRCPWCRVWHYEGNLREINIAPGHIVQDNNLLACSREHIEKVFEMLGKQKKAAEFKGGLDIDYMKPWHIELMKQIRVSELWVACDCKRDMARLDRAADLLSDFSIEKKRCYVLLGYDGENIADAEKRCETVYEKGFLPFAQLYLESYKTTKTKHNQQWRDLARKWARPAAYRKNVEVKNAETE